MSAANCCIPLCGTSRRHKGIGIFGIIAATDKKSTEWRENLLGEIKKTREVDKAFREQILKNSLKICEMHFEPECIEVRKYTPNF